MNKELYNDIKNELDSLSEELATTSYVGGHLLGQKLEGKTGKDKFTVIYAFYEYMSQRESFSFINTGDWAVFFRDNLSNYLNSDNIKSDFDEIISDEKLLNTILKVCNDDVKKDLYDYARKENSIHTKTGSNKYVDVYKKIEESLIKDGLIEKKDKDETVAFTSNETSKSIDAEIENLKKRQEDLETKKVQKRDSLFEVASNSVGIDTEKLIKRVGQDESLNIDAIEVDPQLVSKLAANSAVAATMPNGVFQKLKEGIKKSGILRNVELGIVEIDEKKILTIDKKESIFDKIASSDNEIVRAIYNSAKEKLALFKSLVKPSNEVNAAIKESIINTNEKIKARVLKTANEVKAEFTQFNEAMHEASRDAVTKASNQINDFANQVKTEASNKANDFANRVSDYGVSVREKTSQVLYNMGDKIAPKDNQEENKVESQETPKETYTYINTPDGKKKVIVRSATKVGEIPNLTKDESSIKI